MAKLSDICTINMGQSPESSTYNDNQEGLPFFQGNADFGKINPTVRIWCNEPKKIAQPNDILISVRAPIGALNIADVQCCIGRGLASITVDKSKCADKYIWYALDSKVDYLISMGTGSTFKAIGKNVLWDLDIPLPPLETQKQIAANLDKATQTIDLCNAILEKLDLLVKARFVEMFGDMSSNPFNWDKVKLGTVCDVRDGTHDSPKYYDVGYPLVTSKNVTSGIISFEDCSLICKEDFLKINERSKVDYGDILMPMIGTVGKPVIVDVDREFAIKNVALLKFNSSSKVINIFVKSLLQSDYFDRAVISKVRGGTQKFIALGDIRKLELYLPPLDLQTQFAAFVEKTDRTKAAVQQVLSKAETLKKALMQEYFG